MDEDTTTTQDVQAETGAVDAQPVEQTVDAVADAQEPVSEPEQAQQDADAEEQQSAPEVDDKLQKYAASQGLDLDSPSAIKAAKIAMKAQSEATKNYHKTSELEKSLQNRSDEYAEVVAENTNQDPELIKRLQRVEVREAVRDFWDNNPDARNYEKDMIEILQNKPHLAGDLDSLYANAVIRSGGINSVKSQTKRETLESLAHKQQAAVPRGNATNSSTTPKEKPFSELSTEEMKARLGMVRR